MARRFNITGFCNPQKHYMVRLDDRLKVIKETYVDNEEYFIINRGRQYGKTTTLKALAKYLEKDYIIFSLDFQKLATANFENETAFSRAFAQSLSAALRVIPSEDTEKLEERLSALKIDAPSTGMIELFGCLSDMCKISPRPVVLMIDEVDSASNNQVFIDFLAQLRSYYLKRDTKGVNTFQSVILAGVYDIKNLKRKIRTETGHQTNSPWNIREGNESNECLHSFDDCPRDHRMLAFYDIAADFAVDMSLSKDGIKGMLDEYETDHHTGMNISEMAEHLYDYTSGYPYLVSRLCKMIDEKGTWTKEGLLTAVRVLLTENNMLFESLIGKLTDYPELEQMLKELLFFGKPITYNPTNQVIGLAVMFGFVKNADGKVIPANRIFDTLLYNHFLSLDELGSLEMYKASLLDKNLFVRDGHLDMRRILEKFVMHFHDLYGNNKEEFLEEEGRRYFLLYLRPIINGTGNYYIEARTRSLGRTDIIVDYLGEQFVIETKIWRGNEYNLRGESQLAEYLADYGLHTGYMLSFNFNQRKQIGIREIVVNGKRLIEAVV